MTVTESQLKAAFLRQRQSLPLPIKIKMTQRRIREWYEAYDGQVYVSFSGGLESSILLRLVRKLYPEVPAVFDDTGVEFSEIREFVKTVDNVVWLKPKLTFKEVVEKYGYPVPSKDVAMALDRYHNTKSDVQKNLRLNGGINPSSGRMQTKGVIPEQYKYLIDAPFKCSERCCYFLKKQPIAAYEKASGRKPFVGLMAVDSKLRRDEILKSGCNSFSAKKPTSRPLAFWTDDDVQAVKPLIPHCRLYDAPFNFDSTGCMFCMFGIFMEGTPNRFQRMRHTHPRIWEKALPALGITKVLDFMKVPYR